MEAIDCGGSGEPNIQAISHALRVFGNCGDFICANGVRNTGILHEGELDIEVGILDG